MECRRRAGGETMKGLEMALASRSLITPPLDGRGE